MAGPRSWREALSYGGLILRESLLSFDRNNNFQTAATLAYYGFFSLIPLFLLVVILLGHLALSSAEVMAGVEALTAEILPESGGLLLEEIADLSGQRIWGLVSTVILVWVITPFASATRTAFMNIFKTENEAGLFRNNVLNLVAVLALLLLFILLVSGRILYASLAPSLLPAAWAERLGRCYPAAASFLFVCFFLIVFCPARLTSRQLLGGALLTTVLLFALRALFLLMLRYNPSYGSAFGSLKAIFLVTAWVYYSFLVILFGTEVVANTRRRETLLVRGLFLPPGRRPAKIHPLLAPHIRYPALGETLFREGDEGAEMFHVLEGAVAVRKADTVVKRLEKGDFFGEMSMLLGEPRSASVEAAAPGTRLVAISKESFQTLLRENPAVVLRMLRELAHRLRETTRDRAAGGEAGRVP